MVWIKSRPLDLASGPSVAGPVPGLQPQPTPIPVPKHPGLLFPRLLLSLLPSPHPAHAPSLPPSPSFLVFVSVFALYHPLSHPALHTLADFIDSPGLGLVVTPGESALLGEAGPSMCPHGRGRRALHPQNCLLLPFPWEAFQTGVKGPPCFPEVPAVVFVWMWSWDGISRADPGENMLVSRLHFDELPP